MNRCRRCWSIIEKKSDLRCDYCRKRVDEEINHETSRPLEYYFTYYHANRWHITNQKNILDYKQSNDEKEERAKRL